MVDLVAQYFIQYNKLALPGVGMLSVTKVPAKFDGGRQVMLPPRLHFQWNPQAEENGGLQSFAGFVSRHTQMSEEESFDAITGFCNGLKKALHERGEFVLKGIGKLVRISDETTGFVPDAGFDVFLPSLTAGTVMRTGATHQLLVGDRETDSAEMQLLLADEQPEVEGRWWIAALLLGIAGIALIVARLGGWL